MAGRRAAFTLTELIVSIGVLALMMTMAGAVFHLTLRSTGQAKALTTVTQRLRTFEETLRADLRGIHPESSILVIVPARMNAYWTAAGRDADDDGDPSAASGYPFAKDPEREVAAPAANPDYDYVLLPPRADRLMFVTARQGASFVDPDITSGLAVVTYGHAILGEWQNLKPPPSPGDPPEYDWQWRRQYDEADDVDRRARFDSAMLIHGVPQTEPGYLSPTPAQDWHLARRSVVLVEYDSEAVPPKLDPDDDTKRSVAVTFDLDDGSTAGNSQYALAEGRQDVVASPVGAPDVFSYFNDIIARASADGIPSRWYARSELDITPPAAIAERLGQYFLPHCASFRVEFALDLPELRGVGEVLWIDPGDLVTGWNDCDPTSEDCSPTWERIQRLKDRIKPGDAGPGVLGLYDLPNSPAVRAYDRLDNLLNLVLNPDDGDEGLRFLPDPSNNEPMARWYTTHPKGSVAGEADPLFPVALRVTIDVYDDEQRFERPTRHVMVFKIGG